MMSGNLKCGQRAGEFIAWLPLATCPREGIRIIITEAELFTGKFTSCSNVSLCIQAVVRTILLSEHIEYGRQDTFAFTKHVIGLKNLDLWRNEPCGLLHKIVQRAHRSLFNGVSRPSILWLSPHALDAINIRMFRVLL